MSKLHKYAHKMCTFQSYRSFLVAIVDDAAYFHNLAYVNTV